MKYLFILLLISLSFAQRPYRVRAIDLMDDVKEAWQSDISDSLALNPWAIDIGDSLTAPFVDSLDFKDNAKTFIELHAADTIYNYPDDVTLEMSASKMQIKDGGVSSAKLAIDVDQKYTIIPGTVTYDGDGTFNIAGNTFILNRNGGYILVYPGSFTLTQGNILDWAYFYCDGFSTTSSGNYCVLDFDDDVIISPTWVIKDSLGWSDVIPLAINDAGGTLKWTCLLDGRKPNIIKNFSTSGQLNTDGIANAAVTAAKIGSDVVRGDTITYMTVKKSGGDYSTIASALAGISGTEKDQKIILIYPGIYQEEHLQMEDYVHLRGVKRDSCIIEGEYASTDSANIHDRSTIELGAKYCTIENLTITGYNVRYVIHSDGINTAGIEYSKQTIKNCYIYHQGVDSTYWQIEDCIGHGFNIGQEFTVENCILISEERRAIASHTKTSYGTKGNIFNVINSRLITHGTNMLSMRILYGYQNSDLYYLTNSFLNGCLYQDGTVNYNNKIIISNCNNFPIVTPIDYYPLEINNITNLRNMSGVSISKGDAVKRTSFSEIAKMTNSDSIIVFAGFAMETIADSAWGDIKENGIIRDDLVSESAVWGDVYGVDSTPGTLIEGSGTPIIGRCTFDGYIKILHE